MVLLVSFFVGLVILLSAWKNNLARKTGISLIVIAICLGALTFSPIDFGSTQKTPSVKRSAWVYQKSYDAHHDDFTYVKAPRGEAFIEYRPQGSVWIKNPNTKEVFAYTPGEPLTHVGEIRGKIGFKSASLKTVEIHLYTKRAR